MYATALTIDVGLIIRIVIFQVAHRGAILGRCNKYIFIYIFNTFIFGANFSLTIITIYYNIRQFSQS